MRGAATTSVPWAVRCYPEIIWSSRRHGRAVALRKVGVLVAAALLLGLVASAGFNYLAIRRFRSRNPPPGRLIPVDGRAMHLYCAGDGAPTVVVEPGLGDDWARWQLVQPGLARVTRTCTYDRAGLGYSQPSASPSDANAVAGDLHALLVQAGIGGPLVVLAQSAGALYARNFVARHAEDVAALVLVDGTPPESFDEIPGTRLTDQQREDARSALVWAKLGRATGISRLRGRCRARSPKGLGALAEYFDEAACDPSRLEAEVRELESFERSAAQVPRGEGALGDLPLLIISQDPDRPKPGWDARSIAANPIWAALQQRSMRLSSRSARIIARGSGHQVHLDRPDVIVTAVSALVARLHGGESTLPPDGTTTTL